MHKKTLQFLIILLLPFLIVNKVIAQNNFDLSPEMKELTDFLIDAKNNSYASGDESIIKSLDDGAKEITYTQNNYKYCDIWYGETHFTGKEIVWKNEKVIWSMNFYGFVNLSEDIPEEFDKFHKEALRKAPKEYPFRGPMYYNSKDLLYINDVQGNIENFLGTERIIYKGYEIFRLYYHGGIIKY